MHSSVSLPEENTNKSNRSPKEGKLRRPRSTKSTKKTKNKMERNSSTDIVSDSVGKESYTSKVAVCLVNCKYNVVRSVCARLGYEEVYENDDWNFFWAEMPVTTDRYKEMKRFQKINHHPEMAEICRKDLLARNLNRMQKLFPKDYDFFPKTWTLPTDYPKASAYSKLYKNKTFILKPDAKSQGNGIYIIKSLKDVQPREHCICQVYVKDPFLIDGYKFDLRIYILITSCDPLRVYVHNEGLVRFATSPYKPPSSNNVGDIYMHLTNYAVNRHSQSYKTDSGDGGSKRKLSWFNDYMGKKGHDVDTLWSRIDDVVLKTIISAFPVLRHSYSTCFPNHNIFPACCELLGIDVLLDAKLNPHILEVNHSPSLSTATTVDWDVKETIVRDMFKMMNLDYCDKYKVIRDDRKRVRERLLQGIAKETSRVNKHKNFQEYFRIEEENRGNFRLIYPSGNGDRNYDKFFDQPLGSSLFTETLASKARERETFQRRHAMTMSKKEEAAKRVQPLSKKKCKRKPDFIRMVRNSFKPQVIMDWEEKARLERKKRRETFIENNSVFECVYFSLKNNGILSSKDEEKCKSRVFTTVLTKPE